MVPTMNLNNGMEMPAIGLGTFWGKDLKTVIKISIRIGYRLIDTAFYYKNEKEIGDAIKEKIADGTVKREDLFIVEKLWNTQHRSDKVLPALKNCLARLQLDYVDTFLMHWPFAYQVLHLNGSMYSVSTLKAPGGVNIRHQGKILRDMPQKTRFRRYSLIAQVERPPSLAGRNMNVFVGLRLRKNLLVRNDNEYAETGREESFSFIETWKAMEECVRSGLTKSIGVSNFNKNQLERLLKSAKVKPVINQIECHPYLNQKELIEFCKKHKVVVMAYSPLFAPNRNFFNANIFQDEIISRLAQKYDKCNAQIVLRYLIQLGVVPIPKSEKPLRLKQNISVFDFEIDVDDMRMIEKLNQNRRCVTWPRAMAFKEYPF